jgi:fermentation-respiration switch protein FrsA (DUF1100 family)
MYHLPSFPFVDVAEVFTKVFAHFDCKQFSAAQALQSNEIPVLFIHGGADDFVPTYMSKVNFKACKGEKQLVIIDGAYHLFRLDDSRQVRELTLEEDYGKIEMMAATHLENEKLQKLIQKWRKEVLVEIRMMD